VEVEVAKRNCRSCRGTPAFNALGPSFLKSCQSIGPQLSDKLGVLTTTNSESIAAAGGYAFAPTLI
jgi:hypothetical protein